MDSLLHDFRYAFRSMMRSPGFTLAAVLSLALGIGANTAVFSVLDAALLRPVPVRAPEELVRLVTDRVDDVNEQYSYPHFVALRERAPFDGIIGQFVLPVAVRVGDVSEQLVGAGVSGNYFDVLGVTMAAGRSFAADEDVVGDPSDVVVLSHALWQRRFAGSPDVLGQRLQVNRRPYTIIGVAPPRFHGLIRGRRGDLWVPVTSFAAMMNFDFMDRTTTSWLDVMARRPDGVSMEQTQARLAALDPSLRAQQLLRENDHRNVIEPAQHGFTEVVMSLDRPLTYMMAAVALVLLIACANVANLMLARATARQRELAVRRALGGSRKRLAQQLLTEASVIALCAAVVGTVLAIWLGEALARWPSSMGAVDIRPTLDLRVLGFTLLVTALTAVLFGLFPAWHSSRIDLISSLKERGGTVRPMPVRSALVVMQVALSLALLVGATLLVRTLRNLSDVDVGYTARTALLADIDLESQGYDAERGTVLVNALLDQLRALPGVTGASASSAVAPSPSGSRINGVELEAWTGNADDVGFDYVLADIRYMDVMGMQILQGRGFTSSDATGSTPVAIINDAMAKKYWPGANPIGKRVIIDRETNRTWEIVGVAANGKYRSLREAETAVLWRPLQQSFTSRITLVVRTAADPHALTDMIRAELRALDAGLPLFEVRTLGQHVALATSEERMAAQVAGAFSIVALVLSALGIYGVLAFIVTQRRREIGIRMALGAHPADVMRMVIGRGVMLTLIGIVAGIPAALLSTRLLQAIVFGVGAADAMSYALPAVVMLTVAAVTALVPARRATNADPLVSLRQDADM